MNSEYIEKNANTDEELSKSDWRSKLMEDLVRFHYRTHSSKKNRQPWKLSVADLLSFPKNTLGQELGIFLKRNDCCLIAKYENHDVFHIVLNYKTDVIGEIKMQFCLAGSGRRTLSTFATIIIGTIFYPKNFIDFIKAYCRGRKLNNFSYRDFRPLLGRPFQELKNDVFG